jgi:hypothetical protein
VEPNLSLPLLVFVQFYAENNMTSQEKKVQRRRSIIGKGIKQDLLGVNTGVYNVEDLNTIQSPSNKPEYYARCNVHDMKRGDEVWKGG